jgi:RND family efflux transporter MFP subunit
MTETPTPQPDISSLRIDREKRLQSPARGVSWKIIGAGALLAVSALLFFLFRDAFSPVPEVEAVSPTRSTPGQLNSLLTASGYVVAQVKASVASKGTGRLVFLGVEEGDRVKTGQVVARLEDDDVVAALEQARANLEIARADSDDVRRTLERQRTLFASSLSSRAELDGAEARYRRVLASIRAAEAAVKAADVALENTRIRAPFDGTVLTKDADVGEIVAPFASSINSRGTVVTIADMSSLEVEADVSESNIMRVTEGQECEIILDAYPDRRYPGVVHKVVPTADRSKATVRTRVRFRQKDDRVLPEMSAKVAFLAERNAGAAADTVARLTVPTSTVLLRDGTEMVLVIREHVLVETPVRTGERMGGRIVILDGVSTADRLVLSPAAELTGGARVKVRP